VFCHNLQVLLAGEYGRYGYRRIKALLWGEGWHLAFSASMAV
jgi:hypothetical protein